MFRWTPTAAGAPHVCALLPQLGANHPGGYFTAGTRCQICDSHLVVSVVAARYMAVQMGFLAPENAQQGPTRVDRLEAELKASQERVVELERALEAVEVLKGSGFSQQRRPGRPRKSDEKAAA